MGKSQDIVYDIVNKDVSGQSTTRLLRPAFAKKEALLQVLLDAKGEWIEGTEVRRQMRENYGLSVPDTPGVTSIHQAHFTQWYSKDFSRNVIDARWGDEDQTHAELRIGEKYEDELRDYFDR